MIEHLQAVTRRWYNEQRGKRAGNTKAWERSSQDQQLNIMDSVSAVLEYMEESWQWKS